jgi:Cell division protein CrgA
VTPKASKVSGLPSSTAPVTGPSADRSIRRASDPSSRYTPPVPKYVKESPRWVPVLMFALLILGALAIVLNYLGVVPHSPSNWYLLGGLGAILAGIITATQYR